MNSKKVARPYRKSQFYFRNRVKPAGWLACNPSTQEVKQEDHEFSPRRYVVSLRQVWDT